MAWEEVQFRASRNIASIAFNADRQEMLVQFSGGKVYRYVGVSTEMAAGFEKAESATGYLRSGIEPMVTFEQLESMADLESEKEDSTDGPQKSVDEEPASDV